jgi:hypothetical protein
MTHEELMRYRAFKEALDYRLLDHATGSSIISVEEYDRWKRTQSISHINTVRVVDDAVAASFQDTYRSLPRGSYWQTYRKVRDWIGATHLDLSSVLTSTGRLK